MDLELVKEALVSSSNLLWQEIEAVEWDELREDYLLVIQKIETALKTLEKDE